MAIVGLCAVLRLPEFSRGPGILNPLIYFSRFGNRTMAYFAAIQLTMWTIGWRIESKYPLSTNANFPISVLLDDYWFRYWWYWLEMPRATTMVGRTFLTEIFQIFFNNFRYSKIENKAKFLGKYSIGFCPGVYINIAIIYG